MHYFDLVNIICEQERKILGKKNTLELYTCEGYPLATKPSCYISKLSDWCLETYDPILLYAIPRPKAFTKEDEIYSTCVKKLPGNGKIPIRNDEVNFGPQTLCGSCKEVTVKKLKEYIYSMTSLPPSCFTLEFNYNGLAIEENTLEDYNVQSNPNIVVNPRDQFWETSWDQNFAANRCLATWSEAQTRYGVSVFFSSLYALSEWILKEEGNTRKKVLGFIRSITGYAPLIHALNMIFMKGLLTLPHRVAIQELLMLVFKSISPKNLKGFNSSSITIQERQILEESNTFWAYFIEYSKETHCRTEDYKTFDLCCSIKNTRMAMPHRIIDSENIPHIVDKQGYPNEDETIFETLPEYFRLIKSFLDSEACVWKVEELVVNPIDLTRDWIITQSKLAGMPFLCIQMPLAIKEKTICPVPCMMLRENGMVCNYIGTKGLDDLNPDPYEGFDPLDGKSFYFDADDLDKKLRMGNVTQLKKLEQQPSSTVNPQIIDFTTITRPLDELEEIIMVVLDTSGSMDQIHFASKTKYELAMTGFIQFCSRTSAYNLKNMIGLVIFGSKPKLEFKLTESFNYFSEKIESFPSKSQTAIYDAVIFTIEYLNSFRLEFQLPKTMVARILCLTDGGDNASKVTPDKTVKYLKSNNVVMDSILLCGDKLDIHSVAKLSGGYSFQPGDQKELSRIFENETLLNYSGRKKEKMKVNVLKKASLLPFDTDPEFLYSEKIKRKFETPEKCLATAIRHKTHASQVSPEVTKRILRELAYLHTDPHPSFEVFPCSDAVDFWNLMLEAPKLTPYERGVFRLYVEFTKDYPNKAPNIRFITPIYHCNINSAGRICHKVLDKFYSPAVRMREILNHLYGLLLEATPDDPLDSYKADLHRTNKEQYDIEVKKFTTLHARVKTKTDVRVEILGGKPDNISDYPAQYICPLSKCLFKDPVVTPYGDTYEREAIEEFIRDVRAEDPFRFQPLQIVDLRPNKILKQLTEQHKAQLRNL